MERRSDPDPAPTPPPAGPIPPPAATAVVRPRRVQPRPKPAPSAGSGYDDNWVPVDVPVDADDDWDDWVVRARAMLARAGGTEPVPDNANTDDVCYGFRDSGKCRFGASCRFSHVQR